MSRVYFPGGSMSVSQDFKAGDQPPKGNGYIEMEEWAEAQMKAGLKQKMCSHCSRWKFPQQIESLATVLMPDSKGRLHEVVNVTCKTCEPLLRESAAKHGRAMTT